MHLRLKTRAIFFALLALLHIVAFSMPAQAMSSKKTHIPCTNLARLKMGTVVYNIPRLGKIAVNYTKPYEKLKELCSSTEPLEVQEWAAMISLDLLLNEPKGAENKDNLPHLIQILVFNVSAKKNRSQFENVQKWMELQKIKIDDLPIENGFRVWRKRDWLTVDSRPHFSDTRDWNLPSANIYIAKDPELTSPSNEPAVFVCRPARTDHIKFERCKISIWDRQSAFTSETIDTRSIPKAKWKAVYRGMLKLRQSLLANPALKDFESPQ